jgi:hypothetical protein
MRKLLTVVACAAVLSIGYIAHADENGVSTGIAHRAIASDSGHFFASDDGVRLWCQAHLKSEPLRARQI